MFAALDAVITAHAKMRKFEQPNEQGAYDRWEMKLSKQVAPLLKEWCDMLLFLNYKTYVVTTETNAKKAQGGKRVIYTSHHPCWDAKNRHSLPEEMDLDFKNIAHLFKTGAEPAADAGKPTDLILNRVVEFRISAFFRCIGQKKHGERLVIDWNRVVGSRGRAHFKPRTYTDRDGNERQANDVDRFYDYDEKFFPAEDDWMEITGDEDLPFN